MIKLQHWLELKVTEMVFAINPGVYKLVACLIIIVFAPYQNNFKQLILCIYVLGIGMDYNQNRKSK